MFNSHKFTQMGSGVSIGCCKLHDYSTKQDAESSTNYNRRMQTSPMNRKTIIILPCEKQVYKTPIYPPVQYIQTYSSEMGVSVVNHLLDRMGSVCIDRKEYCFLSVNTCTAPTQPADEQGEVSKKRSGISPATVWYEGAGVCF